MKVFLSKIFFKKTYLFIGLIIALLGVSVIPVLISKAIAAGTFTSAKVTISDSRAGQTSVSHAFSYVAATTGTIATIDYQYCGAASGTCNAPTGLIITDITVSGVTGIGVGGTSIAGSTITYTVTSPASVGVGTTVAMTFNAITNPSTADTTSFVRVTSKTGGAATIDSATVAFAVLTSTSIAVTASVDPTLTFTVTAANTGTVNGASINVGSSANAILFGTLSSGSTKIAAHDLSVTTNASNGYTVTVKALAGPPLSEAGGVENIDTFTGTNDTPTTWSSPAGTSKSVNTGFFGYTTNDTSLGTGTAARFNSNKWAGTTTSALEVAYSSVGVGSSEVTRVGWQAEVNAYQPQGAYSGTVVLVATPTY